MFLSDIIIETVKLYMDSKEGKAAIYGNEALYKVYTVMVVPPLKKDSSNEKKDQSGNKKQNKGNNTFGKVLSAEQEKVREDDLLITATGYSKDLRPVSMLYKTREYL